MTSVWTAKEYLGHIRDCPHSKLGTNGRRLMLKTQNVKEHSAESEVEPASDAGPFDQHDFSQYLLPFFVPARFASLLN